MSTQEQAGEYTGSFIPAHVMLDPELTPIEKMLYATIASWRICFASNEFLAERLGLSKSSINQYIIRLKKKGYVEKVSFDGRQRVMRVIYNAPKPQQGSLSRSRHAEYQDLDNIDMNIEKSNPPTGYAASRQTAPPKEKNKVPDSSLVNAVEPSTPRGFPSTTLALFYQVIKKYSLTVNNHNQVKKWAKDLEDTQSVERAQAYLNRLLQRDLVAERDTQEFVPTLNTAFDVYNKSTKIIEYLKRTKELSLLAQPPEDVVARQQEAEEEARRLRGEHE